MDHWLKPLAFSKDARARALVPAAARSKLQPRHSGSYTGRTKASSSIWPVRPRSMFDSRTLTLAPLCQGTD